MDEQELIISLQLAIAKHFRVNNEHVKVLDMPPAVAKGESQLSILRRVKYRVNKKTNEITEGSLILKFVPMDAVIPPIVEQFFGTEVFIYTQIINVIGEMIALKKLEPIFPTFIANMTKRSLLIEDLCSSGFKKVSRTERFGVKEAKVAFRSVGQLHATSWIAQSLGKIQLEKLQKCPVFLHNEWRDGYVSSAVSALVLSMKSTWGPEWAARADEFGAFLTKTSNQYHEEYANDKCEFKVFCHGDLWAGNVLFKMEESGEIKGVRFIDFQLAHYGSYYWDLLYLIANGFAFSTRKHLEEIADEYAEGLKETFETFEVTPPYVPSAEDVKKVLKRLHAFIYVATVIIGPRQAYGSDDLLTTFDGEGDPAFLSVYQNPSVQNELKMYYNEYHKVMNGHH